MDQRRSGRNKTLRCMNRSTRNSPNKLISFNLCVRHRSIRLIEWRHPKQTTKWEKNEQREKKRCNGSKSNGCACVRVSDHSYACVFFFSLLNSTPYLCLFFGRSLQKWAPHYQFRLSAMLCSALIISLAPSLCWIAVYFHLLHTPYANIYSPKSALDSLNMAVDFAFLFSFATCAIQRYSSWDEWEFGAGGKKVNTNKMIEVRITRLVCVRVFYASDWINSIRVDGCHPNFELLFGFLFVRSCARSLARGRLKNSWFDSVIVSCCPRLFCLSHGLLIWWL